MSHEKGIDDCPGEWTRLQCGDHVDCRQDRLRWLDAAQLGERLKELERGNIELRQVNEIRRKA